MGLENYKKKRDFDRTPEPEGGAAADDSKTAGEFNGSGMRLKYAVQRHMASHLHYDLRLEWGGVLKSWAVPKGPSMDPHDKRLAIMVEDHPLDYIGFHGVIPEGNYGAGTVEIWDSGSWEPALKMEDAGKALDEGMLEFYLNGTKLKGGFVLIRTKNPKLRNGWLLIKHDDAYAVEGGYNAEDFASAVK